MTKPHYPTFSRTRDATVIVAGEAALDGANPTPINHGLSKVVAVFLQLKGNAAPGDNTSVLTYNQNGLVIDVYGWKNTSGNDPTLVASTGTETFSYMFVGE